MTNLLPELLPLILSDRATSWALVLVNKHYNDIVTPILYKQVILQRVGRIKAFSDTMVSGRPKLRQYPRFLYIIPYAWGRAEFDRLIDIPAVKQILMHVPNLSHLSLVMSKPRIHSLIKEPRYPFKLRQLDMTVISGAIFIEFLRTQPEIEHVYLRGGLVVDHFLSTFSALRKFNLMFSKPGSHDFTSGFCETVPELSRFDVWQKSCPSLEEVTIFGITLKKM
ncbi:hypothetical protein RSAG8_06941, partial [Rhizoctonia solani AG-8 WAC10335]